MYTDPYSYMGPSYVPQTHIMAIWVQLVYSAQIIAPISQGLTQTTPLYIRWTHIKDTFYHGTILCQLNLQGLTRHTYVHKMDPFKGYHLHSTMEHFYVPQ